MRVVISANISRPSRGTFCTIPESLITNPQYLEQVCALPYNRRMTTIKSFRDLSVWQVSMDLADVCFDIVEAIPHPYLTESLEARLNAQRA